MTSFRIATQDDDAVLRAILRENAMPTWVEMAIEREPSFFAGADLFGQDWAVLAEEEGDVIGMYTAAVLPVHVDGRPERLGYLGGLRVNPHHRRRIRYLREGYASIRRLAPVSGSLPWWFTVIAAENRAARRLLESGLSGLPSYQPQGEYRTYALPSARGRRRGLWRRAAEADVARIVAFHNARAARFQYSPVLGEGVVRRIGVGAFFLYESLGSLAPHPSPLPASGERGLELHGVAALWDQRAFKQIVARRYLKPARALIPIYNLYARLFRRIPLPREGNALHQTSIAFLALSDAALSFARPLLEDLLSHCATPAASIGVHAKHPLVPVIQRMKAIPYPSRVYAVSFEGPPPMCERPVQPEAALL